MNGDKTTWAFIIAVFLFGLLLLNYEHLRWLVLP